MVSPTAYQSEGASQFGLMPIGAGPFKVTSNLAGVSINMNAWPGYYAAKTRYLSGLHFAGIATGDRVKHSPTCRRARSTSSTTPRRARRR